MTRNRNEWETGEGGTTNLIQRSKGQKEKMIKKKKTMFLGHDCSVEMIFVVGNIDNGSFACLIVISYFYLMQMIVTENRNFSF